MTLTSDVVNNLTSGGTKGSCLHSLSTTKLRELLSDNPLGRSNEQHLSAAALLIDVNTSEVLFRKNSDQRLPIASLAKMMTVLLALEAIDDGVTHLDAPVFISGRAALTGGSKVWLAAGERLPLKLLLAAVMVASANDAAVAVAEHLAGSEQSFVEKMMQRANGLGMKNTKYLNATGLPLDNGDEGYSTAADVAILAVELLKHPDVICWSRMEQLVFRESPVEQVVYNTNPLIGKYPGCDGLKTGSTDAAGHHLVATASLGEQRLLAIVMQTPSKDVQAKATTNLLNWGFGQIQ